VAGGPGDVAAELAEIAAAGADLILLNPLFDEAGQMERGRRGHPPARLTLPGGAGWREPLAQDEQIADAVDGLRAGFRGHRGVERGEALRGVVTGERTSGQ
jgi:hypothetical protein